MQSGLLSAFAVSASLAFVASNGSTKYQQLIPSDQPSAAGPRVVTEVLHQRPDSREKGKATVVTVALLERTAIKISELIAAAELDRVPDIGSVGLLEPDEDDGISTRAALDGLFGNSEGSAIDDDIHVGDSLGSVSAVQVIPEDETRF